MGMVLKSLLWTVGAAVAKGVFRHVKRRRAAKRTTRIESRTAAPAGGRRSRRR
jgi:hypothetical protein